MQPFYIVSGKIIREDPGGPAWSVSKNALGSISIGLVDGTGGNEAPLNMMPKNALGVAEALIRAVNELADEEAS